MPYINSRVSVAMTDHQKEIIKAKLGQLISIFPGKSENWLMVEFNDECDIYFKGKNNEASAFIEVKVFGNISDSSADKMSAALCELYEKELGISPSRIYIKYESVSQWGWNGGNF